MATTFDDLVQFYSDHPPMLDNNWEFEITEDFQSLENENIAFAVSDIVFPQPKLLYETAPNGEKYFTGIQYPDEFSITVRESLSNSIAEAAKLYFYDWYQKWMDNIYDFVDQKFLYPNAVDSSHSRIGILRFKSWGTPVVTPAVVTSPIQQDNILSLIARTMGQGGMSVFTAPMNSISSLAGVHVDAPMIPPTIVDTPVVGGPFFERKSEQITIQSFRFINMKPVGIEPISLTFTEGKPLEYRLNFICDRVDKVI